MALASDFTALYWLMLRSKDFKQAVESIPRRRAVSGYNQQPRSLQLRPRFF